MRRGAGRGGRFSEGVGVEGIHPSFARADRRKDNDAGPAREVAQPVDCQPTVTATTTTALSLLGGARYTASSSWTPTRRGRKEYAEQAGLHARDEHLDTDERGTQFARCGRGELQVDAQRSLLVACLDS